ncbi:restriction endonuclease subunit S [Methanosarcina mazei]|uniref:Type I restriction modification DNA specificity domain-containing protein n=1 Tax=Methanosarcina mazei TaxID=2209 RepID=A0A0F8JZ28_METMZ|nr:restriction endonuclease subunit S [Methanosarcina mazei]KKG06439.1 hypothetical protein DU31_11395 [Methanosarcina mazei]KKG73980.1 hypothetical protein DU46_09505 [Methanosarcina mazei]KKG85070.1 hypothetical protein DU61_10960 [Methanosarcina mazei]KKG86664.1 hypothetical protein DU57_06885 [Methanosarcina mazei]KKG95252.1 hypothetical protein DU59_03800 [Methanosarcina mazei]
MTGEWKECKLGDAVEIDSGFAFKSELYSDKGSLKVVRGKNVTVGQMRWGNDAKYWNHSTDDLERYFLNEGDVVIGMDGSKIGENRAQIKNSDLPAILAQRVARLKAKENSDQKFIWHLIFSDEFENYIKSIHTGTSIPHISQSQIASYDILLPPLPEQHAIASVLSSLDDKIDLLHRQNKTLEAMAETLFRQWFVEEADEEWKTGKLGDIADINPTYKLKKGDVSSYLDMKNLNTSTFNPEGWCKRGFSSGMKFKNGDTLLARITPCLENGKTCYVDFLDEDEIGWGSTEYIVIRMKNPFHPFISYILAKDKDFRDFAISSMSGSSGRQRAQAGLIKEYGIKLPPFPLIEEINIQLAGIVPKLENNAKQIRTLEKLRDTLLPKLMSGEVRVECEDMG